MANLLVVDDEPKLIFKQVSRVFAPRGWQIELVRSGSEAIRHIGKGQTEVVLLDDSLPDMGGLDVYQHIRQIDARIPGLVATPLTFNEARLRAAIAESEATDNPPKDTTIKEAAAARAPHMPLRVPWVEPEDLAPAAVFLALDLAEMVTGACYDVTGGDDANNQS